MLKPFKYLSLLGVLLVALSACGSPNETAASEPEEAEEEKVEEAEQAGEEEVEEIEEVVEEEQYMSDLEYLETLIPSMSDDLLSLNDTTRGLITEKSHLFPATSDDAIAQVKEEVNSEVNSKQLNKNVSPYYEDILTFEGYVITVDEEVDGDQVDSFTHVMDDEGNSYEVIMFKSTGDVFEEDRVRFWGAPVGIFSFENLAGGHTKSQMFVGSHLEKVE